MTQYDPSGSAGRTGRAMGAGAEDRDPEEIRVEIEQTRTEMSGTIDAIQQRLAPEVLTAQAKDVARDATDQAKSAAQEVLQDAVREVKDAAKEVTAHAVHEVRDAARDVTSDAKDAAWDATVGRAEHAVSNVGESAKGATSIVIETIKQNPFPAALAALSVYWLYRNRPTGQTSYGPGQMAGSYQPYQPTRTAQAYPIRTGYASEEERQRMLANEGRPAAMATATGSQGASYERASGGGVMDTAGRMASNAASSTTEMASEAASTVSHLATNAGETAMDTGSSIVDIIQRNPVPSALVGIGLGWLYMNRSSGQPDYRTYSGSRYRYGSGGTAKAYGTDWQGSSTGSESSMIGRATDTVGDLASSAQERVGDMTGAAQERVSDLADTVVHGTQRAPGQIQQMVNQNPLTTAAVAAALGAAVGLWLPPTQVENQIMGKAHDQAMDKVQRVASDTMEKVEDVAQEVRTTAREEAHAKGLTI